MSSPCHKCQKHDPTCHGKCEDYKIWSDKRKEISKQRILEGDWKEYNSSRIWKRQFRKDKRK